MESRHNDKDGASLVWVPGGSFVMGSDETALREIWSAHGWDDYWWGQVGGSTWIIELCPHQVGVDGFWMYREPVTIGEYYHFMQDSGHPAPVDPKVHGPWNSAWEDGTPRRRTEDLPASSVSWEDAVAYCRWANAQLPTEAQWEYAARGPEGRVFPWGDVWEPGTCRCAEEVAGRPFRSHDDWRMWLNAGGSSRRADGTRTYPAECWLSTHIAQIEGPTPADRYPSDVSWCGIRQMAGQVRQWCADWYDSEYYPDSPDRNPPGPAQGRPRSQQARVIRGGAWCGPAYTSRGAQRLAYPPNSRDTNDHGFRPVVPG